MVLSGSRALAKGFTRKLLYGLYTHRAHLRDIAKPLNRAIQHDRKRPLDLSTDHNPTDQCAMNLTLLYIQNIRAN